MAKKKRSRRSKYLIPAIALAGAGILGAIALKSVSAVGQSYNCVNGSCVAVSGTGGQYATLAACQTACGGGVGPIVTIDQSTYDTGGIITWHTTGWTLGQRVQAIASSAGGTLNVGAGEAGNVGVDGSLTATLQITFGPGSYLLFVQDINNTSSKTPTVPFTVVIGPQAGNPKIWFSMTPGSQPLTEVPPMYTKVYLQGSGWPTSLASPPNGPYKAGIYVRFSGQCFYGQCLGIGPDKQELSVGGVINADGTIYPGPTGINMNVGFIPGSAASFQGWAYGLNGIALGPQSEIITLPVHVDNIGRKPGYVTFLLKSGGWNPALNRFAVDTTLYTWAPNSPIDVPLTAGAHAITDIELLQFQDLRVSALVPDGDVTLTGGYNFTTGGAGGSITVYVCSISNAGCSGMGQAPPPPPPPTPTGPVTLAINGESSILHLPLGGGRIFFSGEGYTPYVPLVQPDPHFTPKPVVGYISSDGNYLHNYRPESFVNQGLFSEVDALGHGSGTWAMSITVDSTWHFVFWDTGRNLYSNQVDVIIGAGTPPPAGSTTPPPYIPPTTPPTLYIPNLPTDANGLPELHLLSQNTAFILAGSGWGLNTVPNTPPTSTSMVVQPYVEAQNLPIPGSLNPWRLGIANLDKNGNITDGSLPLNNIIWPPGQILTIYGILLQQNPSMGGFVSLGVRSQPWQVRLV